MDLWKKHGYAGLEDAIEHFERRRRLELRIIAEIMKEDCTILAAKKDTDFHSIQTYVRMVQ